MPILEPAPKLNSVSFITLSHLGKPSSLAAATLNHVSSLKPYDSSPYTSQFLLVIHGLKTKSVPCGTVLSSAIDDSLYPPSRYTSGS